MVNNLTWLSSTMLTVHFKHVYDCWILVYILYIEKIIEGKFSAPTQWKAASNPHLLWTTCEHTYNMETAVVNLKKKKCKGPSAVCPMRPLEGEYLFSCVSLQLNPCSFFLVNLILSFILLFIIVLSSELFLLLSLASWNSLLIFSFFPLSVAKNPTELCLNPAFSGHVIVLSDSMTDLHFPNIDTL